MDKYVFRNLSQEYGECTWRIDGTHVDKDSGVERSGVLM